MLMVRAILIYVSVDSELQVGGSGVLVTKLTYIFDEETPRWRNLLSEWGCNLGAWSASGLFYKFVIRLPLLKHVNPYAEVRPCGICCVPLRFRKFWLVPPCIVLSCLDSRHIYLDHLRCIDRVGESCWACVCISCAVVTDFSCRGTE